jgi:hypothetical protein
MIRNSLYNNYNKLFKAQGGVSIGPSKEDTIYQFPIIGKSYYFKRGNKWYRTDASNIRWEEQPVGESLARGLEVEKKKLEKNIKKNKGRETKYSKSK